MDHQRAGKSSLALTGLGLLAETQWPGEISFESLGEAASQFKKFLVLDGRLKRSGLCAVLYSLR